ncbi:MAG: PilZ domain-containing protein [Planctomycetota bacterium]|jgi:hypothetical protein
MDQNAKRQQEERLGYRWPVRFSADFAESMTQSVMVDISSGGVAFDCQAGGDCPEEGQHLTIRFSIPRFEGDDPTATVSITRTGGVCRVEEIEGGQQRVAVAFDAPLPLRPSEVTTLSSMCSSDVEP